MRRDVMGRQGRDGMGWEGARWGEVGWGEMGWGWVGWGEVTGERDKLGAWCELGWGSRCRRAVEGLGSICVVR